MKEAMEHCDDKAMYHCDYKGHGALWLQGLWGTVMTGGMEHCVENCPGAL